MQFVESSIAGVRVAVLRLKSPGARCTYTLLPMIHVGEAQYYAEVRQELERHDYVLLEGVRHKLAKGAEKLYARVAASPRIRLVTQRVAMQGAIGSGAKWVHVDISREDFHKSWRGFPLWQRLLIPPLIWVVFTYLRWFGDRPAFGKVLVTDDLRSRREILGQDDGPGFNKLVVDQRDPHIVAQLDRFHEQMRDKPCSVAVLFGAGHMRAIARHLMDRHRYQVFQSRWLTVFGWDVPGRQPATYGRARPLRVGASAARADRDRAIGRAGRLARRAVVTVMGLALQPMLYLGFLSLSTMSKGYSWEDMDWNGDGRTSFEEFLRATETEQRQAIVDGKLCLEIFVPKDGTVLRRRCQQ